ncbi:hypothetical protein [Candidatus Desulfovibrio trichonymphae]|uniref:hypothetical protein n=1 Tax=Candidatus Desulfovibrio trichonymphae TaxID=1725232 RepID=UPI0022B26967|nr:hypothetical protein [Candidatus Desulfovibrio trichonymphae]
MQDISVAISFGVIGLGLEPVHASPTASSAMDDNFLVNSSPAARGARVVPNDIRQIYRVGAAVRDMPCRERRCRFYVPWSA